MFLLLDDLASQFRLWEWRDNLVLRRHLFREATIRVIDGQLVVKAVLAELRRLARYTDMRSKDRDSFRQWETFLRKIVHGWTDVTSAERVAFRGGDLPPSTLAKRITKRGEASRNRSPSPS